MKNDAPNHPKMHALAEALGINHGWAVGIMECLWHWGNDFAQAGDIGKYTNEHISRAVHWPGDPTTLVNALVKVRWLDTHDEHRLLIHDWFDHCERTTHAYLIKRRLRFATGQVPEMSQVNIPEREGIHEDYDAGVTYPHGRPPKGMAQIKNIPFPELWNEFWEAWPKRKKQNRIPALQAWCKAVTTEQMARIIIRGVHIHKQPGGVLAKENPQYIPYAVTWLNNRRWEEPYEPTGPAKPYDTDDLFEVREPTLQDLMRTEFDPPEPTEFDVE